VGGLGGWATGAEGAVGGVWGGVGGREEEMARGVQRMRDRAMAG